MKKTIIVTGASQGIGAGIANAFLARGYNVVATSRNASKSTELQQSDSLAVVDGDIGDATVAAKVVETAVQRFGGIDGLVNNAGIFIAKPFTDYTKQDFDNLVHTNLEGTLYITQYVLKQLLAQKRGGSVVGITTTLLSNPVASLPVGVAMMTKGGMTGASVNLALEYAKDGIRFNLVAPGIVDTPMHKETPRDFMKSLSPMGSYATTRQIADAVVYLTEAEHVTGETLNVGGGAQRGHW
ncbi:SDR family NAD(P)-dependent oxidoreductase [Duganella callida]|uniref:SDR family oxidoreductase n=1 Tax=Duganella callida TaxID=2561932 RepID=A0A4Y9SU91_9BURK|nr:SDR family NAD(P)-dependent oxidoreductase [Duganella callida]TFW29047.1 SDR family oxidoreductase [Duganella callida]